MGRRVGRKLWNCDMMVWCKCLRLARLCYLLGNRLYHLRHRGNGLLTADTAVALGCIRIQDLDALSVDYLSREQWSC